MKLNIPLGPEWTETSSPEGQLYTHAATGIRIEVDPIADLPDERKAWGETLATRNRPPGGDVKQLDLVKSVSTCGWPMIVGCLRYDDAAGEGVELRLIVIVELLHLGSTISVRVPRADLAAWERAWRETIVSAIRDVDADFGGGLDYLGQLFQR